MTSFDALNPNGPPKVSIVIPTYNRGEVLCQTMEMALAQDYDVEVIVVDQSANVPLAVTTFVEQADRRLRYVRLATPNLPAARNAGVRLAKGDIIAFIDDDVVIGPEYIRAHVRNYADSTVGGLMGLTLLPGQDETQVIELTCSVFGAKEDYSDGTWRVSSLLGCNCSFRKEAIMKAGMSDPRFSGTGWGEDGDLALRVEHAGYRLLFDSRIPLLHLALSTGGCSNRDAQQSEHVRDDHCKLNLFYWIKNASILGKRATLAAVWRLYRSHSLNLVSLRSPELLFRRQYRFAVSLLRAIRLCFSSANVNEMLVTAPGNTAIAESQDGLRKAGAQTEAG